MIISFLLSDPITNVPESIASGLSVEVLILTAGNYNIELSSAKVPISESVTYEFSCKKRFFPVSGKLVVYGLIEKKQKEELLISSNFSNLNNLEEIDDWFSSELSRLLQNHNKWTK